MAKYLLLIRAGEGEEQSYTPEERQAAIRRYSAWAQKLHGEGRLLAGDELGGGGAVVRLRDGQVVVDGPYPETKESIGGYFTIEAASLEEASEISKECPAVANGGSVDVRPIIDHG